MSVTIIALKHHGNPMTKLCYYWPPPGHTHVTVRLRAVCVYMIDLEETARGNDPHISQMHVYADKCCLQVQLKIVLLQHYNSE